MRALYVVVVAGSIGCSFDPTGAGTDAAQKPADADPTAPDADPTAPDADPTAPDADPTAPDASPGPAIRINIAGPAHTGVDYPGQWQADLGIGGICGPNLYTNASGVTGTVDDALFQAVMWGNPMTCAVAVGPAKAADFEVRLYFGEVFFGAGCPGGGGAGNRVFDIVLEGVTELSGFDVFAEGGCVADTADVAGQPVIKSFAIPIDDGILDVSLPATANEGFISAIEVVPR